MFLQVVNIEKATKNNSNYLQTFEIEPDEALLSSDLIPVLRPHVTTTSTLVDIGDHDDTAHISSASTSNEQRL
jgi:hypothetical protein